MWHFAELSVAGLAAMESTAPFEMAPGLTGGWKVVKSEFRGAPKKLEIYLEFKKGNQFECPECGDKCAVHDTAEKRWRHLNFFQYECELIACVPRVRCEKHGVRLAEVPWARPGSGFTLMFEASVMMLAKRYKKLGQALALRSALQRCVR